MNYLSSEQVVIREYWRKCMVARWWGLMAVTSLSLLLAPYDTVKTWFHTGLPQNLEP
jgi:hypothetical protein